MPVARTVVEKAGGLPLHPGPGRGGDRGGQDAEKERDQSMVIAPPMMLPP